MLQSHIPTHQENRDSQMGLVTLSLQRELPGSTESPLPPGPPAGFGAAFPPAPQAKHRGL